MSTIRIVEKKEFFQLTTEAFDTVFWQRSLTKFRKDTLQGHYIPSIFVLPRFTCNATVELSSQSISEDGMYCPARLDINIGTGEMSQAITHFHFFDYYNFSNFYHEITFITRKLLSQGHFYYHKTFSTTYLHHLHQGHHGHHGHQYPHSQSHQQTIVQSEWLTSLLDLNWLGELWYHLK